nr:uncharacterized protein LOC129493076 isoform X3 [Symphalangus syndactylus]
MKDSSVDLLTEENNTNYKPWPSVVVKATDVRCQPLASCLTVEGYSTDWTEMPCPETRNLERQPGKKGYQRLNINLMK